MIELENIVGFEWDQGNQQKSADRHGVSMREAEQVFADENVMFLKDVRHSATEQRFQALGKTKMGRFLAAVFTLRQNDTVIRIISVRDMDRRERACYD